jgi:hypothetical protein
MIKLVLVDPQLLIEKLLLGPKRIRKNPIYQYIWSYQSDCHQLTQNKKLFEIANSFNLYRDLYEELSFEELKGINTIWYHKYPNQKRFDLLFVRSCIKYLTRRLQKKDLFVAELGGYQGELAYEILKSFSLITWKNIEIIPHKRVCELAQFDYEEIVLTKPFWLEKINLKNCDVFIMSDSVEHFNDEEAKKIFNIINKYNIKSVIIKSPLNSKGQKWYNYCGSHLLRIGSNQIKKIMKREYRLVKEYDDCFFWVKRDL